MTPVTLIPVGVPATIHAEEVTLMQEAELNIRTFTKEELVELTKQIADEYGVSPEVMIAVVQCESQFNPDAYNASENSRGLVQIHEASHPTITDEQAYDPYFALHFLGENLANGNGKMWTCFRQMKKAG